MLIGTEDLDCWKTLNAIWSPNRLMFRHINGTHVDYTLKTASLQPSQYLASLLQ